MKKSSIPSSRFYKISNSIFKYGLKPIEFAAYSFLVCCAGNREQCYPSIKTIAANCNCSVNAARNAIHKLEERRFIIKRETFRQYGDGKVRQVNNMYYMQALPYMPGEAQPKYLEKPSAYEVVTEEMTASGIYIVEPSDGASAAVNEV